MGNGVKHSVYGPTMPTSTEHAEKAERALEDALQSLRDAVKHTDRRDLGSYQQALSYVGSAIGQAEAAERALRSARDAAAKEPRED